MSRAATDRLVTDNMGYVVALARQYAGRGVDLDDLVGEGSMALVEAAHGYDAGRGVPFVGYAASRLRRAMERAVERQAGLRGGPRSGAAGSGQAGLVSVDEPRPLGSHTGFTLLSVIENRDAATPAAIVEDGEQTALLTRQLAALDGRERRVLALVYGLDGEERHTMAEAGTLLGLKRERVRQVRDKALRKLRRLKAKA